MASDLPNHDKQNLLQISQVMIWPVKIGIFFTDSGNPMLIIQRCHYRSSEGLKKQNSKSEIFLPAL